MKMPPAPSPQPRPRVGGIAPQAPALLPGADPGIPALRAGDLRCHRKPQPMETWAGGDPAELSLAPLRSSLDSG